MHSPVKTFFRMEMTAPHQLCPAPIPCPGLRIRTLGQPAPEFNWFFHEVIGAQYNWGGRSDWSLEDWRRFVCSSELETAVLYENEAPAGYYEIERQPDQSDRILCFGLLESFIGRGLGGYLLTRCIERCWRRGAERIWLRTCTHDHPHALSNYKARGFQLIETTVEDRPSRRRERRMPG